MNPSPAPRVADLDPTDWPATRVQAHRMLDDILDYVEDIRERPVWRPIPDSVRTHFTQPLPRAPGDLAGAHQTFMEQILPYAAGNSHPGFMGWVHGGGNVAGLLAEMLAAGLNANLGGRDQAPIVVERQVARWMADAFGFPPEASGIFVTGTSIANFIALLAAKTQALGRDSRQAGLGETGLRLTGYASKAAHGCVSQAFEMSGLGGDALRRLPTDAAGRMDLAALAAAVDQDRRAGLTPFFLAGTAGSVGIGAIDDLQGLADFARDQGLWFHVDAAYAALAILSPELAGLLTGIERADSIAFDFHKWGQAPYDAGFILLRDGDTHRAAFAAVQDYLRRESRGLAGGSPWPCDYGPDLSRGFRALKVWFAFQVYGADAMGAAIAHTCKLASYLAEQVDASPELERLAPVALNICCFRYRAPDADAVNAQIVIDLQEAGAVAPSATLVDGRFAIRAAIVNHRTQAEDIDRLIVQTLQFGRRAVRSPTVIGV